MFCSVCGKEIPDDAVFCSNCGSKVEKPVVAEVKLDEEMSKEEAVNEALTEEQEKEDEVREEALIEELVYEEVTKETEEAAKENSPAAAEVPEYNSEAAVADNALEDLKSAAEPALNAEEPVAEKTPATGIVTDEAPAAWIVAEEAPAEESAKKKEKKEKKEKKTKEKPEKEVKPKAIIDKSLYKIKKNPGLLTFVCVVLSCLLTVTLFWTVTTVFLSMEAFDEVYNDILSGPTGFSGDFYILTSFWSLIAVSTISVLIILLIFAALKRRKYAILNYTGFPLMVVGGIFTGLSFVYGWLLENFELPELMADLLACVDETLKGYLMIVGIAMAGTGAVFFLAYIITSIVHKVVYRKKCIKDGI